MTNTDQNRSPHQTHLAGQIALTALVYLGLGLAGLALAIPPGYASPIFPAAGFAVAIMLWTGRRAWLGIALGSVVLNLSVGDLSEPVRTTTVLVALGVGAGSTVQAYVAALLVERAAGRTWEAMETLRDIVRIFIVAGPLACLISASVGVATLYGNGLTQTADLLFSWWNWWTGDTLGVLVALPLCLTWLLRSQSPWRERRAALGLPMLITLGVIAAGYVAVSKWERAAQDTEVRSHGERLAKQLEQRFIAHQEALAALKRLIEVTPDMSYEQFDHFTRLTLRDNPDIFALSFNPYVRLEERARIERRMARATQKPDFEIKERDAQRRLVRAGERPGYVVVGYIAPQEGNRAAIGYDINSEPVRKDAIVRARESHRPSVTAPVQLVQENRKRVGALLLHPAYETTLGSAGTQADGRLLGFAVGVIKLDQMAQIATEGTRTPGLAFRIADVVAGQSSPVFQSEDEPPPEGHASILRIPLPMADRTWELSIYPTAAHQAEHRPWAAWGTGAAGVLLATLLLVLLLVTTGQAAVAERKATRQGTELETQGAELKDRTALINMLFELSPDGFVAFGSDGTIQLANPAFHNMTGIGPDEIVGQSIGSLNTRLRQCMAQPERFTPIEALFVEGRAGTAQETLVLARPRAVVLQIIGARSNAASIDRFVYFRDVTHETEVDRLKSEFLSTAAHELRTPMASVFGFSELLMTKMLDEATQHDLAETIHRNAGLMSSIINELLDLARIEARRGEDFVFEPVNVRTLVAQTSANYMAPPGRDAPLLDLPAQALWMRADSKKMEQALSNVISNAYKYSPKGGEVRIGIAPPGSEANEIGLRIIDQGLGMTPEQVARVCERFYRADTSGKIPGTGLGMSIVSEILALHRGRVEITSERGAGTEVTLWIPAAAAAAGGG